MPPPIKIFVGSLPQGSKPHELRMLFEVYGVVVECDVMNRCGFVHMQTIDMAKNAIAALNDSDFKGQKIIVEEGRPKNKAITGTVGTESNHNNMNDNLKGSGNNRGFNNNNNNRGRNRNFNGGSTRNNNYKQRSAPYTQQPPNRNIFTGDPQKNDRFNRNQGGNFNQGPQINFMRNQDSRAGAGPTNNQFGNNNNATTGGFRNHKNDNNFGSNANQRNTNNGNGQFGRSGRPNHANLQDRRGFALPNANHQQQSQFNSGNGNQFSRGGNQFNDGNPINSPMRNGNQFNRGGNQFNDGNPINNPMRNPNQFSRGNNQFNDGNPNNNPMRNGNQFSRGGNQLNEGNSTKNPFQRVGVNMGGAAPNNSLHGQNMFSQPPNLQNKMGTNNNYRNNRGGPYNRNQGDFNNRRAGGGTGFSGGSDRNGNSFNQNFRNNNAAGNGRNNFQKNFPQPPNSQNFGLGN
ncbi:GATA zinc finger domain-containing protein 14-like isoform X2 [Teleopsis dalmanni]|uniref:GATA zinc finger domain-containing protein 14-like isoform X2 n=1 Tax=Teleopsis dalmanni TaxID=139649 RepID=UPI0018CED6D6|nr:GATA zinc finger domain-containing protein 14-like isoform X2 [Teleopsis dalmanni]